MKYEFLIIAGFLLESCSYTPQQPADIIDLKEDVGNNPANHITFNYSATRIDTRNDLVEIKAFLVNDYSDTVYFITTTCNGEQYSLVFDTVKYRVEPSMECTEVIPIMKSIPPHGRLTFQTTLKTNVMEERINLGFDLYQVDRGTSINGRTFKDIHQRSEGDKNIIWTDKKLIE